ncbi:MAG: response regulator [Acidobacteriaceae bacterium]|nr:response regulator [Acidobacteriaceae bacterium]
MVFEAPKPPRIVLLVEDSRADARLIKEALRDTRKPVQLHIVENGDTALQFLQRGPGYENAPTPDLVLLDLNLPGIDGRDVLRAIRKDSRLAPLPVIVLTSSSAQHDVDTVYRLGGSSYLHKPSNLDEYLSLMKTFEVFWLEAVRLPAC